MSNLIKISELKKINTLEDLKTLENRLGTLDWKISHRGGGLGFSGEAVAEHLDISPFHLSKNYGCGCNYLGGGIRGAIFASGYSKEVTSKNAKWLDTLADACIRVYNDIEKGGGLQAEEYEDGETNWENCATNRSRRAGIVSAY